MSYGKILLLGAVAVAAIAAFSTSTEQDLYRSALKRAKWQMRYVAAEKRAEFEDKLVQINAKCGIDYGYETATNMVKDLMREYPMGAAA